MEKIEKKSKIELFVDNYNKKYRCPICHSELSVDDKSLTCENKHTFNINKKGFVNLEPNKHLKNYTKELFLSRFNVLSNGYYEVLVNEINKLIEKYQLKDKSMIDAGCGEGTFLNQINVKTKYGVDLASSAIIEACNNYSDISFIVGDLANIPLCDDSVDVVLNILSPANYNEFERVLNKEGYLIKVIPNNKYLLEIRKLLNKENLEESNIKEHLLKYCDIVEEVDCYKSVNVTQVKKDFIKMIPLAWNLDKEEQDKLINSFDGIVTIDLKIIVAKMKGC